MVLGLKFCADDGITMAGREAVYKAVLDFAAQFKEKNNSLLCRELIGFDMSKPDEAAEAAKQGVYRTICPRLVQEAAEILEDLLVLEME